MKNVLFINPNKDFFSNPTLVYLLKEFGKKGLQIHLVMPTQSVELPESFSNIKHVKFNTFNLTWPKKIWKWLPIIRAYFKLISYCKKNEISTIIGVDPYGIIIAGRLKRFLKQTEIHYISFEIFFRDELKNFPKELIIKKKEINYSHKVSTLIIQDEIRFNLLISENNLDVKKLKTYFIPVAPEKSVLSLEEKTYWRTFYREKLGIEDDEIVLLHSGSVAKWSGGELILDVLKRELPSKVKILVHSKFPFNSSESIQNELLELKEKGKSVILHDNPFSDYQSYLQFLQVADFGLALYQHDDSSAFTGKNIEHIGLASGKFATYMSQDLPTIVTFSENFEILNQKYNFGCLIHNSDDFFSVLSTIDKQIIDKSTISELYENELNPKNRVNLYLDSFYKN
ncbi:MAG: hypothetical protein V4622_04640 [Bacteroidota bacterium]